MWYKNIAGRFFGLVTKYACDRQTDGQTDRQNYDSQDRAVSRGKNQRILMKFSLIDLEMNGRCDSMNFTHLT